MVTAFLTLSQHKSSRRSACLFPTIELLHLLAATGNDPSPAFYLIARALPGLALSWRSPYRSGQPLP